MNPVKIPQVDKADDLAYYIARSSLPRPCREYLFAPGRKYRADFAWPPQRLLVEVDGGQYKTGGGRHNTDADRDKLNLAAILGYRVLRFSSQRVDSNPMRCVSEIEDALRSGCVRTDV